MTTDSTPWPREKLDALRALVVAGVGYRPAARQLGLSANAVICKAARLRAGGDADFAIRQPQKATRAASVTPPEEKPRFAVVPKAPAMPPAPRFVDPAIPAPAPRHVSILDLGRRECSYETGRVGRTALFCGHAVTRGSFYPFHAALVYTGLGRDLSSLARSVA